MEFQAFHDGRPLNLFERGCLQSFIDHGHSITLFSYEPLSVPPGVRVESAQNVVSEEEFQEFMRTAAYSNVTFSDYFRFSLLEQLGGWWVDTDVLCLSADVPSEEIVLGWEAADSICTAIMRMPMHHPLLALAARTCKEERANSNWAHTGPGLLTRLVKQQGLESHVLESKFLYPIPWDMAVDVLMPDQSHVIEFHISQSPFLHLWHSVLRSYGIQTNFLPPAGSFLHKALMRHGGSASFGLDDGAYLQNLKVIQNYIALNREFIRVSALSRRKAHVDSSGSNTG